MRLLGIKVNLRVANFRENETDFKELVKLEHSLLTEVKDDFPFSEGVTLEKLREDLADRLRTYDSDRRNKAVIAEVLRYPVGFVSYCFGNNPNDLTIGSMYVRPCFRRFGVGDLLLGTTIKDARHNKVGAIYLVSSSGAEKFYKKHGFVECGKNGQRNRFCLNLDS